MSLVGYRPVNICIATLQVESAYYTWEHIVVIVSWVTFVLVAELRLPASSEEDCASATVPG